MIEERQAAVEAILKKGHIPAGMELFTAGDKSQWDVIKKWIDESDIYLLILGGRYGSIDNETGLSYTEMEYNYALEKKKPFFALSLSDDILNNKSVEIIRDFDLKNPKYISFKEKVKSKMCAFPKNIDQIKTEINHSLDNLILENKISKYYFGYDNLIREKTIIYLLEKDILNNMLKSVKVTNIIPYMTKNEMELYTRVLVSLSCTHLNVNLENRIGVLNFFYFEITFVLILAIDFLFVL